MPETGTDSPNYWKETACARAFWGQHELPPYRQLLADTVAWLDPQPDERWLDLGCGCGKLTQAIWEKSTGRVKEVIGIDCAAINATAFASLRAHASPPPRPDQIRFVHGGFDSGLASTPTGYFDGVVSGLAIQYAESFDNARGSWTTATYDHVLGEVFRVLRPGGVFVFSVNVPKASWLRVALASVFGVFRARRFVRYLRNAWRMWRYGAWLHREVATGRFHYLPRSEVFGRLERIGYEGLQRRRSFVGQAYLIRCWKPARVPLAQAA